MISGTTLQKSIGGVPLSGSPWLILGVLTSSHAWQTKTIIEVSGSTLNSISLSNVYNYNVNIFFTTADETAQNSRPMVNGSAFNGTAYARISGHDNSYPLVSLSIKQYSSIIHMFMINFGGIYIEQPICIATPAGSWISSLTTDNNPAIASATDHIVPIIFIDRVNLETFLPYCYGVVLLDGTKAFGGGRTQFIVDTKILTGTYSITFSPTAIVHPNGLNYCVVAQTRKSSATANGRVALVSVMSNYNFLVRVITANTLNSLSDSDFSFIVY